MKNSTEKEIEKEMLKSDEPIEKKLHEIFASDQLMEDNYSVVTIQQIVILIRELLSQARQEGRESSSVEKLPSIIKRVIPSGRYMKESERDFDLNITKEEDGSWTVCYEYEDYVCGDVDYHRWPSDDYWSGKIRFSTLEEAAIDLLGRLVELKKKDEETKTE